MIYWTDPKARWVTWNSSYPPAWAFALIKGENNG